jgi:NADPH-dependent curcumin reductase
MPQVDGLHGRRGLSPTVSHWKPMTKNMQVLLASRPDGWVTDANFNVVETPIPTPKPGELLVKNLYLSLDPYMRGRISATKSYARSVEVGEVMVGGTVGQVIESSHPTFQVGDHVVTGLGWQHYGVTNGEGIYKVDPNLVPLSYYVGIVGMPGATAWWGLNEIGKPRPGETVAVSAASGAVGSVVGQLAKIKGCRVVGIAGGKTKCDYVVNELKFDACVDYKAPHYLDALRGAAPKGVDFYFENVGGEVMDAMLRVMNPFSRIALCGLIAEYNDVEPRGIRYVRSLLVNRINLQGFIISDHIARWPGIFQEIAGLINSGKLKYRETVTEGLANAPRAFVGLLKGENFGKQLIKL